MTSAQEEEGGRDAAPAEPEAQAHEAHEPAARAAPPAANAAEADARAGEPDADVAQTPPGENEEAETTAVAAGANAGAKQQEPAAHSPKQEPTPRPAEEDGHAQATLAAAAAAVAKQTEQEGECHAEHQEEGDRLGAWGVPAASAHPDPAQGLKDTAKQVLVEAARGELKQIAEEQAAAEERYKQEGFAQDESSDDDENDGARARRRANLRGPTRPPGWEQLYATPRAKTRALQKSAKGRKDKELRKSQTFSASRSASRGSKRKDGARKFEKDDDAKNCTFQPRINRSSRAMLRSSGSFLQRIETGHEAKVAALETRRAKADYEAKVDKKRCPSCRAEQSYDEFKNRKNKCRDCKVAFRHKVLWQDVGDSFLSRVESKMTEREEKLAVVESKMQPAFFLEEKTIYDREFETTRTLKVRPQTWERVEHSFMRRMESDARRRELKRLLAERDAAHDAGCTFRPCLSARGYSSVGGFDCQALEETFEERMERDTARRATSRRLDEAMAGADFDPGRSFKSRAAWDDTGSTFSGGQRRNPRGKWL